jgi:hypothetical protein
MSFEKEKRSFPDLGLDILFYIGEFFKQDAYFFSKLAVLDKNICKLIEVEEVWKTIARRFLGANAVNTLLENMQRDLLAKSTHVYRLLVRQQIAVRAEYLPILTTTARLDECIFTIALKNTTYTAISDEEGSDGGCLKLQLPASLQTEAARAQQETTPYWWYPVCVSFSSGTYTYTSRNAALGKLEYCPEVMKQQMLLYLTEWE